LADRELCIIGEDAIPKRDIVPHSAMEHISADLGLAGIVLLYL
jgi:hypothetical protein